MFRSLGVFFFLVNEGVRFFGRIKEKVFWKEYVRVNLGLIRVRWLCLMCFVFFVFLIIRLTGFDFVGLIKIGAG